MPKPSNTALDAAMPETTANAIVDPKANWEYVTVPDRDILDYPFPGIGINLQHFGPGTHKVPPDIAQEIRDRLAMAQKQDIKLFSAKVNMTALAQLAKEKPEYLRNASEDAKVSL